VAIGLFVVGTAKGHKVTVSSEEMCQRSAKAREPPIRHSRRSVTLEEKSAHHCNYLRFCGSNVVKLFLCAAAIP